MAAAGKSINIDALDAHIGNLVNKGSRLIDSLPIPQGQELWDELRQSASPVAGLFREQARCLAQKTLQTPSETVLVPVAAGFLRRVTLEVTLISGSSMPTCDSFGGKADPFCKVA